MAGESDEVLNKPEYWDQHYSNTEGDLPTHEWYRTSEDLANFFQENLFDAEGITAQDDPLILHLGSGDSVRGLVPAHTRVGAWLMFFFAKQAIPAEFASKGYRRQLCVNFSATVVSMMTERYKNIEGIEWRHADVRSMDTVLDKSIKVAFNKGTLDTMIHGSPWSPTAAVRENSSKYLHEVRRFPDRLHHRVLLTAGA